MIFCAGLLKDFINLNYQETLQFLFQQLPMYQRVGSAAFKKDLTNIKALLEALGNPQEQFASIHVGGTNGKGSVTHLLGAALQAGGFKTGMYTSPHFKDFRERIKIGNEYVEETYPKRKPAERQSSTVGGKIL